MALDVSKLTAYTDENMLPLIKKTVLGGKTLQLINVQPDIKSTAAINILNGDLVIAAGGCGFTAQGTTELYQRDLAVTALKVNESLCPDTLEKYYTQHQMKPGSYNEEIPFEQAYTEMKADKIAESIEQNIWKGNTAAFTAHTEFDGFIELLRTESDVINANTSSATAITASNIVALVDDAAASIHGEIIESEDLVMFMGYDNYRLWARALRNANLFHYDGKENQEGMFSMYIPGTNVLVVATKGLNGTNQFYASKASNFTYGTDLLNDYESFKIWFSEDNQEVRFVSKWKSGVQVAFPDFISRFKLA